MFQSAQGQAFANGNLIPPSIPPFYNIWNINVKNYVTTTLQSVNDFFVITYTIHYFSLYGYVDGHVQPPPPYIVHGQGFPQLNPSYFDWLSLDQCITCWLFATLSNDLLSKVHDVQHFYQIWETFSHRFNTMRLARTLDLKCMLTNLHNSYT